MKVDVSVRLYKCPIHRFTFQSKDMRAFAEEFCVGRTLNLFCGPTMLDIHEVRNDLCEDIEADYHMDAFDCISQWNTPAFDAVLLDPPYSYRKSMEFYEGKKASSFLKVKDWIPKVLNPEGRVITYGYHSHSMGKKRGFKVHTVAVFSHGGAIHDTIATVEVFA